MILEVQNGCFGYPKQPVILENINLRLEEGHILAILGPNGIGKTTLLKCMIGLLPWHSGKTLLYGKDIHTLKPKDVWSTISYIPQSRGFAFSYTGLEMVLLGRSAHLGTFQQPGKEEIEMAEAMMPNAQPLSGMILVAFGSARLVPGRSSSLGNVPTMWCVVSVRSRESFS